MRISVSIYATDDQSRSLEEMVQELDDYRVDMFHVDCLDDHSVFSDIKTIRSVSSTPIDLHIITDDPGSYYDEIAEFSVDYVTFQHEDLPDGPDGVQLPSSPNTRFGIAITSATAPDAFDKYADQAEFVMFMATTPGKSGGQFDKSTFQKIRAFKARFPGKKIHVDGGVNDEVSFILRNLGVFASVSGSYVFNSSCLGAALMDLRNHQTESRYRVQDFMIGKHELPLLPPNKRTLRDVLVSIDQHRLGFTILVDDDDRLEGIIANADVRKGLIEHLDDIDSLDVAQMVNRSPVFINEQRTVRELLSLVKAQNFPVTYIPVTNKRKEVTGAVTFFNLVDGEL